MKTYLPLSQLLGVRVAKTISCASSLQSHKIMSVRVTFVLLISLSGTSSLELNGVASRRALIQTTTAAVSMLSAWPAAALTKKCYKNCDTGPPKCYDSSFKEISCQSTGIGATTTDAAAATTVTTELNVNNFIANDFKVYRGLYPTIASKLLSARTRQRTAGQFPNKQALYDSLDSDAERDALRKYDALIVIKPVDEKLMQFKVATGTTGMQAE